MYKQLTKRELEIVQLIVAGKRNKDVARALAIAENTVEQHLVHIYQKLGLQSRIDLVHFYYAHLVTSKDEQ